LLLPCEKAASEQVPMGIKLISRKEERKKGELWFPVFLWGGFLVDLKMGKAMKWIKVPEFEREASN